MTSPIAVLIISCDRYSHLWPTAAEMLGITWPNCPYDKYLLTNEKEFVHAQVRGLSIGPDISWSHGVRLALEVLSKDYTYVFTMLEDFYFDEVVDNEFLVASFSSVIGRDGNFLSAFKLPSRVSRVDEHISELQNNVPYRRSCVFTLWKISTLLNILDDSENAWQFEKIGVKRGFQYDGFFQTNRFFKSVNLLVKGQVVPWELKKVRKWIPSFEPSEPMMPMLTVLKTGMRDTLVHLFLNAVPSKIMQKIYFR